MIRSSLKLGITGSIGMGKTTIAKEIATYQYPVWNSDKVVHLLYKKGNLGYKKIKTIVPEATVGNSVNREVLSKTVVENPFLLKKISTYHNVKNNPAIRK